MQLTNGALKEALRNPGIALGVKGKVITEDPTDEELEDLDLSAFMVPALSSKNSQIKPSDKTKKEEEAGRFLKESEDLSQLSVKYEQEVVARGHQSLYELLASIYSLALRIEESTAKEQILELMRKNLKEKHEIKVSSNANPITTLVRYVVRADKMTASRYVKVLQIAKEENLSAQELPAYIGRRGGVSQIQETESKYLAKKEGGKSSKERLALIREYFVLQGWASKQRMTYDGEVMVHNEEKDTKAETSSFCFFMADYVNDNEYKIISLHDLGKTFEDNIVKFLGKNFPSDLHILEAGIRNFKRKIAMDESLPEPLREKMKAQLKTPAKYARHAVIDVDAKDTASEE